MVTDEYVVLPPAAVEGHGLCRCRLDFPARSLKSFTFRFVRSDVAAAGWSCYHI